MTRQFAERGADMAKFLSYKGYIGSVELSLEDDCYYGKLLGIEDLILYEGKTYEELEKGFHYMTDLYIQDLAAEVCN